LLIIAISGILPPRFWSPLSIYMSLDCLSDVLVLAYHPLLFLESSRIRQVSTLLLLVNYCLINIRCWMNPKLAQVQGDLIVIRYRIKIILAPSLSSLNSPRSSLSGRFIDLSRCGWVIRILRTLNAITGLHIWVLIELYRWYALLMCLLTYLWSLWLRDICNHVPKQGLWKASVVGSYWSSPVIYLLLTRYHRAIANNLLARRSYLLFGLRRICYFCDWYRHHPWISCLPPSVIRSHHLCCKYWIYRMLIIDILLSGDGTNIELCFARTSLWLDSLMIASSFHILFSP
jgi:hypothetical protein